MMKNTKKEAKLNSLIHQRIRNASFVSVEHPNTKKFKYNVLLRSSEYINKKFVALKALGTKIIQKPQLWVHKVDFKAIKNDVSLWLVEAFIEGFVINFIVWALIGWRFNLITMAAWGFAIKQLLSVYWRLRKDGANATIPIKDD